MPFSRPCQLNNNNKRDYENERVRKVKLKHNFFFLTKKKYKDEETKSRHRQKTSEVKNQNLTGGEQQHFHHQKIKSLRPKPTAIQAKTPSYQKKTTKKQVSPSYIYAI